MRAVQPMGPRSERTPFGVFALSRAPVSQEDEAAQGVAFSFRLQPSIPAESCWPLPWATLCSPLPIGRAQRGAQTARATGPGGCCAMLPTPCRNPILFLPHHQLMAAAETPHVAALPQPAELRAGGSDGPTAPSPRRGVGSEGLQQSSQDGNSAKNQQVISSPRLRAHPCNFITQTVCLITGQSK